MWMEAHQIDARPRPSRVPQELIVRPAGRLHRSPVEVIVGLQRLAGNQAVSSLMRNRPTVQRCGDHPCDCAESEAGETVPRATSSSVAVSRQRAPATTTAPRRGTAASAPRLDVRPSINGSPCACVVFIHNNERNAKLTAELMHDHCAYNLAIISPDAASRRITLPGHRNTVDPNELFTPDIADRCVRDEQACRDFVTNNAGARDNRTIDRVVRTQFFLAIRDCSAGFSLPVIALHNNAREDTAAYSRGLANQRRAGRDSADLRMDVDKTGAERNQTVAEMLRRLRTRFGADVQRGLTERAGSTNIFRWCASNDLSRCHIGDPDRPDNVIWTTNARDFEALSHTNVNVALQSQLPPGPGSESSSDLSTLFIVLRTLTPPSLQLLLDAIQHQRAIDEAQLRAALQEIGRMNPATMGDAAARAIAELLQIADGVLRQGQLVADRLSRLRYVNIETPGLPRTDQSDAERVANYQFISGALSTLGLDCCGPDPAAAHSRIEAGLRAPSAH